MHSCNMKGICWCVGSKIKKIQLSTKIYIGKETDLCNKTAVTTIQAS